MKSNYHDKFRKYLKNKNLKFTPERKHILDTAFSLHQHFDIKELYRKMRRNHKNTSRATLYRTLPLLVDSGLIRETPCSQNRTSYEHIFGHNHHDHLLCIGCGKIIEFSESNIEKLQEAVCRRYSFQPMDHRLGIKGYCKKCQEQVFEGEIRSNIC